MKRVYYRSLAVARHALKEYGLTPARFDIVYALYNNRHFEAFRVDLVEAIGTVKSNIWRLCDALEEMGLAKREWDLWRVIKLTPRGIALVRRVLVECADLIAETVAACAEPPEPASDNVTRLGNALRKLRSALDDKHLFDIYAKDFRDSVFTLCILPKNARIWQQFERAERRAAREARGWRWVTAT